MKKVKLVTGKDFKSIWLGTKVLIRGSDDIEWSKYDHNLQYAISGIDLLSESIWLTVTKDDYDGYSGDAIYGWDGKKWTMRLTDSRSSLPSTVYLQVV